MTFIMKNSQALSQHEETANQSHFSFQVQTEIHSVYLSFRFLLDSIDHDSLLTSAKGSRWWHSALRNTQNAIIIQCVWLLSESEWRINCSEMFNHYNFTTLSHPPPVKNTSIQKRGGKPPVDDEGLYVKSAIISNQHWGRQWRRKTGWIDAIRRDSGVSRDG